MEKKFKYDAFISYRHTELDKFVAGNLHKKLESYHLPKNVAKKRDGQKNRIERVFRDKEELPLTNNLEEPILEALQDSEWLIVVCSPRIKESLWCKKEIETFISLRGRDHVLAVLIEGEPEEAFPEELLYEMREVEQPDGTVVQERTTYEPLAADFRGKNKKEVKKAMDAEIIRLLAAMFGMPYDDLRQRHRERKLRRLVAVSLGAGAACLAVGMASTVTAIRINEQKERIEAQSEQILAQTEEIRKQSEELEKRNEDITKQNEVISKKNDEILKQNEEITKKNEELALHQANALSELAERYLAEGNREEAKKLALQVLVEQDGIRLPYTAKAQRVLTESLSVYDVGRNLRPVFQLNVAGCIEYVCESSRKDVLAVYDASGTLRLYDTEQRKELLLLNPEEHGATSEKWCAFLGEDRFVYFNKNQKVSVYNYRENRMEAEFERDVSAMGMWTDVKGNYLVIKENSNLYTIYGGQTLEKIGEMMNSEMGYGETMLSDGRFAYIASIRGDDLKVISRVLCVWDLNTAQMLLKYEFGDAFVTEMKELDDVLYVFSAIYSDLFMKSDAYVTAISLVDGEKLWETVLEGQYPEEGGLYLREDSENILCITADCLYTVSRDSGKAKMVSGKGDTVLSVLESGTDNYFLFFDNGDLYLLLPERMVLYDVRDQFACVTKENSKISFTREGIWVLATKDNHITFYGTECGPEVKEVAQSVEDPNNEIVSGTLAIERAANLGCTKPENVDYVIFSEDKRYCVVQFWNNVVEIYDAEAQKLLATIENIGTIEWCAGPDANGLFYLWGVSVGYVLNEQMEVVARIEGVDSFDVENRKVYIRYSGVNYEIPIYSLEELLALPAIQ